MIALPLRTLAFAIAASSAASALAAPASTTLTLYPSDDGALFSAGDTGAVQQGYAVAREPRQLELKAGTQDVNLGGLPQYLDSETLILDFDNHDAKVLSQRLRLAQGQNAALGSLVGQQVDVIGGNGERLAAGTLLHAGDGLLVHDTSTADDRTALIRDYAAVKAKGSFQTGSSLQLQVDAARAGSAHATLSYATGGLGWRAAYVGTLLPGNDCQLRFESRASIANKSGRDWNDAKIMLIAGQPHIPASNGPRPMTFTVASRAKTADAAMPEQASLGDFRTFSLPGTVDLPDGSITQTPLYDTRTIACERTAVFENGPAWSSPQPMIARDYQTVENTRIISMLQLKAFDTLPSGTLRVLTNDRDGTSRFIGGGAIENTPKGRDANLSLGVAFDLTGKHERTAFTLNRDARTLDEAFRVTLNNAGDSARVVTVREHATRWHQWSVASSSIKPSQQTPDTLEFKVTVPANGTATLDYTLRYQWSAEDHPQG